MLYREFLILVDDIQILRTWVSRLRYKVEEDLTSPQLIRTMPKTGYIIEHPLRDR